MPTMLNLVVILGPRNSNDCRVASGRGASAGARAGPRISRGPINLQNIIILAIVPPAIDKKDISIFDRLNHFVESRFVCVVNTVQSLYDGKGSRVNTLQGTWHVVISPISLSIRRGGPIISRARVFRKYDDIWKILLQLAKDFEVQGR